VFDETQMMGLSSRLIELVKGSIIAGMYAGLVYALAPISFQEFQVRVADALLILPFLDYFGFPAVVGLTIGCVLANIVSPYGVLDIAVGSLANFAAGIVAWFIGRRSKSILALITTSIIEALIVSFIVGYFIIYLIGGLGNLLIAIGLVLVGSIVSICFIGVPLALFLMKRLGLK